VAQRPHGHDDEDHDDPLTHQDFAHHPYLILASTTPGDFTLGGQRFQGLNGGPEFAFTEAVSLLVACDDQAEIDRLWSALSAVPEAEACGWLKDRFGVSWQIAPRALGAMMTSDDRAAVERVTAAFMKMKKLDLPTLERAFAGPETVTS